MKKSKFTVNVNERLVIKKKKKKKKEGVTSRIYIWADSKKSEINRIDEVDYWD